MLLVHAIALAEARSYLAALADAATTFCASVEYDRVLLQLDALYGDHTPALHVVSTADSGVLYGRAEAAIEALIGHGADALQVELLLAALEDARDLDAP